MSIKTKYGEWALITGASSGIGEEYANYLAKKGMNIILIARREDKLNSLSEKLIEKYKIHTKVIVTDLSKDGYINDIIDNTNDLEVGMIINNAGFGYTGEMYSNNYKTYSDMVKVNCLAPTEITGHFLPKMVERKKGAIIFLGSLLAYQASPFISVYAATKVFNQYMGEGLWYELKIHNIDVLSVNPGATATEFQRVSNMDGGPMVRTSSDVVDTTFKALGKKPSVVDGFVNKISATFGKLFPRRIQIGITGGIVKKLLKEKE